MLIRRTAFLPLFCVACFIVVFPPHKAASRDLQNALRRTNKPPLMFILYAYFYSPIEDSDDGLNGFRIWREHFPEEEEAIAAPL